MTVTRVENLPETFRPPSTSNETAGALPGPLADLIREATSELTDAERGAFLQRLHEERPEIFSEGPVGSGGPVGSEGPSGSGDPNGSRGLSKEGFSKEEWREKLTHWLKEEANRYMAAAASL